MKKKNWKILMVGIILGSIFGFLSYMNAVDRLEEHALVVKSDELDTSDIWVASFLHRDFDRFDYLWRDDSRLLLLPIIFYFTGSLMGAHAFLKRNKGYDHFVYARCPNHVRLSSILLGQIWFPLIFYSLSYFTSLFLGMLFFRSDLIEPVLTLSIVDLTAFFFMRLLVLSFLVLAMFVVFIKRETAMAILANMLIIAFLLLVTIHVQVVNLALLDDFGYLVGSLMGWGVVNLLMYLGIRFSMTYELS